MCDGKDDAEKAWRGDDGGLSKEIDGKIYTMKKICNKDGKRR